MKTKQHNVPVLDTTRIVFNKKQTLFQRFLSFLREVFR